MRHPTRKEARWAALATLLLLAATLVAVTAHASIPGDVLGLAASVEKSLAEGDVASAARYSQQLYERLLSLEAGVLRDNPALADRLATDASIIPQYPYVDRARYTTVFIHLAGYDAYMAYQVSKLAAPGSFLEKLAELISERLNETQSEATAAGEATGTTPQAASGGEGEAQSTTPSSGGTPATITPSTEGAAKSSIERLIEALGKVGGVATIPRLPSLPGGVSVPSLPEASSIPRLEAPRLHAPSIQALSVEPQFMAPLIIIPVVLAAVYAVTRRRLKLVVARLEATRSTTRLGLPDDPVIREFAALLSLLERLCRPRRSYETVREYSMCVKPEEARKAYIEASRVYEAVRYGRRRGDPSVVQRARRLAEESACGG